MDQQRGSPEQAVCRRHYLFLLFYFQRMGKKNDFSLSIYIYNRKKCFEILTPCFLAMLKTKGFIEPKGSKRDFEGGFFWDWVNVHTFDSRHRADRRVEGWLRRDGWGGWV